MPYEPADVARPKQLQVSTANSSSLESDDKPRPLHGGDWDCVVGLCDISYRSFRSRRESPDKEAYGGEGFPRTGIQGLSQWYD